jgi:hypothetical protein
MSINDLLNKKKEVKPELTKAQLILSSNNKKLLQPVTSENIKHGVDSNEFEALEEVKELISDTKPSSVYISDEAMSFASALGNAIGLSPKKIFELKIYQYLIDEINNEFSMNIEYVSDSIAFDEDFEGKMFKMKKFGKNKETRLKFGITIPQRKIDVNLKSVRIIAGIYEELLKKNDKIKSAKYKFCNFTDLAIKSGIKKDIENINIKTSF